MKLLPNTQRDDLGGTNFLQDDRVKKRRNNKGFGRREPSTHLDEGDPAGKESQKRKSSAPNAGKAIENKTEEVKPISEVEGGGGSWCFGAFRSGSLLGHAKSRMGKTSDEEQKCV